MNPGTYIEAGALDQTSRGADEDFPMNDTRRRRADGQESLVNGEKMNTLFIALIFMLVIVICFLGYITFFKEINLQTNQNTNTLKEIKKQNQQEQKGISKDQQIKDATQKISNVEISKDSPKQKVDQSDKVISESQRSNFDLLKNEVEHQKKEIQNLQQKIQEQKIEIIEKKKQISDKNKEMQKEKQTIQDERKGVQELFTEMKGTVQLLKKEVNHKEEEQDKVQSKIQKKSVKSLKKVVLDIDLPLAPEDGKHIPDPKHVHDLATTVFGTPTMGSPEGQRQFNSTPVAQEGFIEFDEEMIDLLRPYNDTNCKFARYGKTQDGSYLLCENFLENSQGFINIGINGADELGCELTTKFPMMNYQYDCVNPTVPVCETSNTSHFTLGCIGESNEKTSKHTFFSLQGMLTRHNLTRKHITLKIDCEGGEWLGFKNFPLEYLKYIDQILIQIHYAWISPEVWGNLDILRSLSKYFVNVNFHVPHWLCMRNEFKNYRRFPGVTVQATFVNRRLIKLHSDSRSFELHPLNSKSCLNPDEIVYPKSLKKVVLDIDLPLAPEDGKHIPDPKHVHDLATTVFGTPTMGSPEGQRQFNSTPVAQEGFIEFDEEMIDLLRPYNDTNCKFARYGKTQDGSYLLCENFLENSQGFINIGINGADELGCELTTKFPMMNYQYDCVNPTVPVCETSNTSHFTLGCIGESNEKTSKHTFFSLQGMLTRHNLTRKHITLKIDCEGGEWLGFKNFPLEYLKYIDQILIQIDFSSAVPKVWGNIDILKSLSKYFVNIDRETANKLLRQERKEGKIKFTFLNKHLLSIKTTEHWSVPRKLLTNDVLSDRSASRNLIQIKSQMTDSIQTVT